MQHIFLQEQLREHDRREHRRGDVMQRPPHPFRDVKLPKQVDEREADQERDRAAKKKDQPEVHKHSQMTVTLKVTVTSLSFQECPNRYAHQCGQNQAQPVWQ